MHLHLIPGVTPDELLLRMDRNNVRWAGAVGRLSGSMGIEAFRDVLGDRYLPAEGQPELAMIYRQGGVAALSDANNQTFKHLLQKVEGDFKTGRVRGFGELIVNNRTSNPDPSFRRKAPTDSPTLRAIFDLVGRYRGFVQIHIQADGDSIAGLEKLMAGAPDVTVILSHCLVDAQPAVVRALLHKHPQLNCELSSRFPPVMWADNPHNIFNAYSAKGDWIALIESFPDRFMVGTDLIHDKVRYDDVIRAIRTGLLPRLSAETMQKVAHGNAQRLFGLK